ncbi:outer membrane beta-barrel protein [Ferruginibacter albus]|uniref:outer membrane beta-barrel protein n=1 Tax=Ferruginibacter albus TaxID=2875540 RepID=UPI001CC7EE63|nr:outer membrane beta-barrel protein [Ferruginibacter albus]UAY53014.1 porin [Ferruginibacter albus]
MTRKIFLPVAAALIGLSANAQDSTKSLTVSGSVDAYYRYNFDAPDGATNNNTSFTNSQNSFELGMATVRLDGSALSGKVSGTADLGFGKRAAEFSYNDGFGVGVSGNNISTLAAVKQLYASYSPASGLKFTMGKWATHIGYELVDAYANRNYSMDYLFSYGPFSHTGLKAEYGKGTWGFMLGVANPTDVAAVVPPAISSPKVILAQISDGSKDGKLKGYLNYQGTGGDFNQVDFVGTATLTSMWSLGLNASMISAPSAVTSETSTSWGAAVYVNADPSSTVGLTLRGEYFDNSKGSYGTAPVNKFYDITLSLDYKVGPFTLIPEVRYDGASDPAFTKSDGSSGTSTFTGLLAAIYKF